MSVGLWVQGARPRTLGAAIAPVLVGTAAAPRATPLRTLACLAVAVFLQLAVNYANDYFDGVKGVDTAARVGPLRLTASGLVRPRAVLAAAVLCVVVALGVGLALALTVDMRLLVVGGVSAAAAMLYSGGPRPYASLGLGELFVFVFFGIVATAGTCFVQAETITTQAWWASVPVGLLAVAILMANNIRDIDSDTASGKRTLAVRLGDRRARASARVVIVGALLVPIAGWLAGGLPVGALLSLAAAPMAAGPLRALAGAQGIELVRALLGTALLHLEFGVMLAVGLWLS